MRSLKKFSASYFLYASTLFLGAFLLFITQPIAAKHLLPYFGGSSSVWATSLGFFTTTLFLGYGYVFLLTRYTGAHQARIHGISVGLVALFTLYSLSIAHSLYSSLQWTVGSTNPPTFNVGLALALAVGGQYFLLATTGPLLQYWWGSSKKSEPYNLYALSNAASLIALVCYPFFIEPSISLGNEELLWALCFVFYALLYMCICWLYRPHIEQLNAPPSCIPPLTIFSWIGLAALPAYVLVSTTTSITQVIAPIPLLWVLPLALYLTTFILAFRGWGQSGYVALLAIAAAGGAYLSTSTATSYIPLHAFSYIVVLFFAGLMCHARLYKNRPETPDLPLFYLLIALGGMIGTLAASIAAPALFSDLYDFPLGVALVAITATWLQTTARAPRVFPVRYIVVAQVIFTAVVVTCFVQLITIDDTVLTIRSRNFYGAVQVRYYDGLVTLVHGTTLHGIEPTAQEWRGIPTSYYSPASGVGRAVLFERGLRKDQGLRVGTIGLGTGSLASYCLLDDQFVFYEIDPHIEQLARTYFTYLSNCKGSSVRIGDGRLLLQAEQRSGTHGKYDILAVDAFSDDTVPAHLLTTQALSLYASQLRSDKSIIALHISNRFLDLAPVVFRVAGAVGLNAMIVRDDGDLKSYAMPSTWILLTKNPDVFRHVIFSHANSELPDTSRTPIWTDDYSSILSALNFRTLLIIPSRP